MNEKLKKQIESELRFLNSQAIKHLVHEADFGASHQESPTIENRKKKLKRLLNPKQKPTKQRGRKR